METQNSFKIVSKKRWYRLLSAVYLVLFVVSTMMVAVFIWSAPEWSEIDPERTLIVCNEERQFTASEVDIPRADLLVLIDHAEKQQPTLYAWRAQLVGELTRSEWREISDFLRVQGARADYFSAERLSLGARERLAFLCAKPLIELDKIIGSKLVVYPKYKGPYTAMNKIVYTHLALVSLFVVFEIGRRYVYHLLFGTWFPARYL